MAFIEGSRIFTDSGFKPIEDIAGRDRVLVRNFLGEAQFTQPFAIKKRKYKGLVTELGGKNWRMTTTPDHTVVYDRADVPVGRNFKYVPAQDVDTNPNNRIYRQFKYYSEDDYKRENVVVRTDFGKTWKTISNEDWYILCAFVVDKGYLESTSRNYALNIYLKRATRDKELILLSDIFDRMGVTWSVFEDRTNDRWIVRVNNKNTLATKLIARLGSKKRARMYFPDKMIYKGSRDLVKLFLDQLFTDNNTYSSVNHRLIQSIELLCTLWGYNTVKKNANGAYTLELYNLTKTYSPTVKKSLDYEGYVYNIELFDGQVYVKNGAAPVWVNPK